MKKTLRQVAHEIATDPHEAGAINTKKKRKHKSFMPPTCKLCELSHIPNAETIAAMEATDRGEGLTKVTLKQLRKQFRNEQKKATNCSRKIKS